MITWCILGCICFAVIILFVARYYFNKYCDEISRILDDIISKKENAHKAYGFDGRFSKLIHQADKITYMIEQESAKTQEEKETVKRLIADLSHQLKTPLSNVMMYSDLLSSDKIENGDKNRFIARLKEENSKMEWLLKSLFNVSRLESGSIDFQPESLHIKETVTQSISAVFGKAYEKNITIELLDFRDRYLLHHRKWTVEALTNILENSIKYSGSGSKITVTVESREIYSAIMISDQGIGIDPKEYNDIFKRFYRSDRVKDRDGAGIGLYLARLIVTKEGGNITVKSELGKGSCFSLFLQNCNN